MFIPLTEHIELERERRSVRKDGVEIRLTGLEFGLLDYLTKHADQICSRTDILNAVWGNAFKYDTGTIDVHLNALRRKLGFTKTYPIETIRGVGLRFKLPTTNDQRQTTNDIQTFIINWLQSHEAEIKAYNLVPTLHLTPFVNEITIAPEVLQKMLDSILAALLSSLTPHNPQPLNSQSSSPSQVDRLGLIITSKLHLQHFLFSIEINGIVSELRIPLSS